MTIPNLTNMQIPERKIPGVRELNIGDQWRAVYAEEEKPEGVPETHAYVVVVKDDRSYLLRRKGTDKWGTLEVEIPEGTPADEAIGAALQERLGATLALLVTGGHFQCRATRHNTTHETGMPTMRGFYTAVVGEVEPQAEDAEYERRRLRFNELMKAIRQQHRELEPYLIKVFEKWLVMQTKGEA
jgi:hypothetical protein